MVNKIVFANFKGGVGKTTNSVMTSYELAKKGYKVLVCDLDPQANSTQLLSRTYALQNDKELLLSKTMMVAIQEKNLDSAVVEIMDNLYLLPSHKDFVDYPDFLELTFLPNEPNYKEKRIAYFDYLLSDIEDDYDFIIFDVPPTLSVFTDTALYSINNIVIVLQTQQRSLDGAEAFWEYAQEFYHKYENVNFGIAGILPVLLKNDSNIDNQIINDAAESFGEKNLFKTIIRHMERLKRYDRLGISEKGYTELNDFHDTKVHSLYSELASEILNRVGVENNE
ncbi:AAA family ATPase [Vagococcus carniphilus]|uniref:ParA family protein n=1 Tax=Vagococcus carniphilus TaxID=218144 RepID=UPI002891A1DC|nr:AAA family ATPase [Vagococcus carniphilus]MDT2850190.1 AAA family ATPase [Vagococcus carniphilus]